MIKPKSPLQRLPKGLDAKQALFLNGVRHAAEFATFAYERLLMTLTSVACHDLDPAKAQQHYTAAFIDAWTIIDAFDRFQSLMQRFPNATEPAEAIPAASELEQTARGLRNVADHLAQRADYVVARQGTALGILTWFTLTNPEIPEGVSCIILPGSVPSGSRGDLVNPLDERLRYPTDKVHLAAGEYRISLSDLVSVVARRTNDIERQLETQLPQNLTDEQLAGIDLCVKVPVRL